MTFLEELARATDGATSIWHQFVVSHDRKRDDWYVFVEGQLDASFYSSALRPLVGSESRIVDFRCDGKQGVLRARADVRSTHPRCTRLLFFVDKDLDDLLGRATLPAADLFCTSPYSIENYFVTVEAMEIVWTQLWMLRSDDPAWPSVRTRFLESIRTFQQMMLPVMAWVLLARLARNKPNLNNLKMSNIVSLVDCEPRLKRNALDQLMHATGCTFRPSLREWFQQVRELQRLEPKSVLRGKFELWMLCRFLDAISQALCERPREKPSRTIPPSSDGIALALLGKLAPPNDLCVFLNGARSIGGSGHCQDGA